MAIKTQWKNNNIFLALPGLRNAQKQWLYGKTLCVTRCHTDNTYITHGLRNIVKFASEDKNKVCISHTTHLCSLGTQQLKRFLCHSRTTLTHTPKHKPLSPTQSRTRVNQPAPERDRCRKRMEGKERLCLVGNLPFVLHTQRNACDYSIDWIICKVMPPPIFSPSHSSALHSLSSQMLHIGCQHIFRDILEHPETGSVYRHLNTCPPTHKHTDLRCKAGSGKIIRLLYLIYHWIEILRSLNAVERLMMVTICNLQNCCI